MSGSMLNDTYIFTYIHNTIYLLLYVLLCPAELLVDKAMALDHIGGVFGGNIKPCPFLCLILKMLQIQPSKDIVIEFIKNPDFKYAQYNSLSMAALI